MRSICPALTREQSPAPPHTSNGDWTSLGQHESLPEFPVIMREKHHTSRRSSKKTTRFPRHHEMKPLFSCRPYRAILSPRSKLHRRLDSLYATQWAPRDIHRNSRGERSSLLPLKTRPDSPGEPSMQPRDPCHYCRGTRSFWTQP